MTLMTRFAAVAAIAFAVFAPATAAGAATTASPGPERTEVTPAATGTAGPYDTVASCRHHRQTYINWGHRVDNCFAAIAITPDRDPYVAYFFHWWI
ncbi:hypothetical protein [Nonomuraea sp. NPDC049709]|uniref:hypothetical protein n=1 Tax=Nonomuraea sp. NPDC049709 TaxID=3154736 RepID=UPI003438DFE1